MGMLALRAIVRPPELRGSPQYELTKQT